MSRLSRFAAAPDEIALEALGHELETMDAAGGRPSTALARRCGLEVRRGIVVDPSPYLSAPAVTPSTR